MAESARFVSLVFAMCLGPLAWAAHLATVYGVTAVVCARPGLGAEGLVAPIVAVLTVAALAAAGWSLAQAWRRRRHDLAYITAALAALSLVAIAWNALPVLLVPPCG